MLWSIELQPIFVMIGHGDREGRLVLVNGELAAVLVQLESEAHSDDVRGRWFFEVGLGPLDTNRHPTFASLEDCKRWIHDELDER